MSGLKPIETEYKGYRFRSRLEARWAVFFDALGIRWEYEPEGVNVRDGTFYLPDFYLIDMHCYFEVKRKGLRGTKEGKDAVAKISYGMDCDSWAGIICFGDPMDDDLFIFCQESDDGGAGSYEGEVTIGRHPETKKPYLLAYEDGRERTFFDSFESINIIPMVTTEYGTYSYEDFVDSKVIRARRLARQARFEHGEMPMTRRYR